jgi:hypothetical protein
VHKDNDSLMVRNSDIKGEGMKQSRKGVWMLNLPVKWVT